MAGAKARQTILAAIVLAFAMMTQKAESGVTTKPCDGGLADVLFILDSSGSIIPTDYDHMLDFAADITDGFTTGQQDMLFSAMIFSSNFSTEFSFTDHLNNVDLAAAIRALPHYRGLTYTAAALKSARTFSFTAANNARNNVAKIAIVITDGQSTDFSDLSTEALLFHMAGITTIAIGVGANVDTDELKVIASDDSLVFTVNDFSVLQAIKDNTIKKICDEPKVIEHNCINSCVGRADGNYPACKPKCQEGYYYSCVNEYTYTMPCALGWYTDQNGRRFTARMVYDPATGTCQLAPKCCSRNPEDYEVIQTDPGHTHNGGNPCLNPWETCSGRPDGNYPICGEKCKTGFYIACSGGESYKMPCALAWYTDSNNNRYLARMVYNAESDTCERESDGCERDNPKEWCDVHDPNTGNSHGHGTTTKPCNGTADILFVLDSSGSIGLLNYQVMLTFAADLTKSFTVQPDRVQFSALAFSDNIANVFNFNSFNNGDDVRAALVNSPYFGFTTNTAAALTIARVFSYSVFNGARTGVGKVAIVITDGISDDPTATAAAAIALKNTGVTVLAIGIGSFVRQDELEAIATSTAHVFTVDNFNGLSLIKGALVTQACQDDHTFCVSNTCKDLEDGNYPACNHECKQGYYYASVNEYCYKMPCPLGYYVDQYNRRFTARMVYDPTKKVCVLESPACPRDPTYYEVVPTTSSNPVIHQNPYNPTCLGARDSCKGKQDGNYPMCYPYCQSGFFISCSNGEAYEMPCPLGWYTSQDGHRFLAKMVYDPIKDACELEVDYCPRTLTYTTPTDIQTTTPTYYTTTPTIVKCDLRADLMFIMDSSGSIGSINFDTLKFFVADLTKHFVLGADKIQISSMYFSSSAQIDFSLDKFTTNADVWQAVLGTPYLAGTTDTADALNLARTVGFTSANGARPATSKVAVIVTDGVSNDPAATEHEADELKRSGVTVVVIAVGSNVRQSELQAMATSPSHIFQVNNFNVLDTIKGSVVTKTCQGAGGCITDSCYGKADGAYSTCDKTECTFGHYYLCSSGVANKMTCGLGWYQNGNGWFTAPKVWDPQAQDCVDSSPDCPRDPWDCRD